MTQFLGNVAFFTENLIPALASKYDCKIGSHWDQKWIPDLFSRWIQNGNLWNETITYWNWAFITNHPSYQHGQKPVFPHDCVSWRGDPLLHDYAIWFQCEGSKLQDHCAPLDWDRCLRSGTPLWSLCEKHTTRSDFQKIGRGLRLQGGMKWLQMDLLQGNTSSLKGSVFY